MTILNAGRRERSLFPTRGRRRSRLELATRQSRNSQRIIQGTSEHLMHEGISSGVLSPATPVITTSARDVCQSARGLPSKCRRPWCLCLSSTPPRPHSPPLFLLSHLLILSSLLLLTLPPSPLLPLSPFFPPPSLSHLLILSPLLLPLVSPLSPPRPPLSSSLSLPCFLG